MDATTRKEVIRRLAASRRRAVAPAEREAAARAVAERVMALDEIAAAPSVLAFAAIHAEVPTEPLAEAILTSGKTLLMPFIDDGEIRAAAVASLEEMEPGYRHIPEPRARVAVDPAAAGVVVVPGTAFDAAGGRVGYGGGFYDRFLRSIPSVPRIGICFEVQIVDEIPMLEHDERVDVVVTEARVMRASAR